MIITFCYGAHMEPSENKLPQNNQKKIQDIIHSPIPTPIDPSIKLKSKIKKENRFFIIDEESIKKIEEGKEDIELILDSRKCPLLSDVTMQALQDGTLGSYEEKPVGEITFKFPKRYAGLIALRQKEGKLKKIILFKSGGGQIIVQTSPKQNSSKPKLIPSQENIKYKQVCCIISDYFPEVKQGEVAFLVYIDEDVAGFSDVSTNKKCALLYHLTPWNINEEKLKEILKSQRLAIIIKSSDKKCLSDITCEFINQEAYNQMAVDVNESITEMFK